MKYHGMQMVGYISYQIMGPSWLMERLQQKSKRHSSMDGG